MEDQTAFLAKKFYKELGVSKMKDLTNKKRDKETLNFILTYLNKKDKILDLACGYGRISFLLAEKGFDIEGVDISPNLIKNAKLESKKRRLNIIFKEGDARNLPYENETFDKIIFLWSSFNHLLSEENQVESLREMYRVLKEGGTAIVELPNGGSKWAKEQIKKYGRVIPDRINGVKLLNYFHDKNTLKKISEKTNFKQEIILLEIDSRERLIWILKKI